MTTSQRIMELAAAGIGRVQITFDDRGAGRPVLLLHGGGGPLTVSGFADLLATTGSVHVISPTHPGFGGTPRPESLTTIRELASIYIAMLEELDLAGVTVVGNSIGGWIAAEMSLLASPRISRIVLVDAVGIEVVEHPVADFFGLTMDEIAEYGYHRPDRFRMDPSKMSAEQLQVMSGNRAALATYAGTSMVDPTLRSRLACAAIETLVIWGESDRIVDPAYGRAYATAIPGARFELLAATGHLPQLESPDALLTLIFHQPASVQLETVSPTSPMA
jgi:pimeloyl-ACP methyl ester carboxylesterase